MTGGDRGEPTAEQFMAALAAVKETFDSLDVDWTARNPIQGESMPKVLAYRVAKAALAAAAVPDRAAPTEGAGEPLGLTPFLNAQGHEVLFASDVAERTTALRAERDALRDTVARIEALAARLDREGFPLQARAIRKAAALSPSPGEESRP